MSKRLKERMERSRVGKTSGGRVIIVNRGRRVEGVEEGM